MGWIEALGYFEKLRTEMPGCRKFHSSCQSAWDYVLQGLWICNSKGGTSNALIHAGGVCQSTRAMWCVYNFGVQNLCWSVTCWHECFTDIIFVLCMIIEAFRDHLFAVFGTAGMNMFQFPGVQFCSKKRNKSSCQCNNCACISKAFFSCSVTSCNKQFQDIEHLFTGTYTTFKLATWKITSKGNCSSYISF